MIRYTRVKEIDIDTVELLRKLDQTFFPLKVLLQNIKDKHLTLIKVTYDEKLYGLLCVRGIFLMNGELALVIDHAIAQDGIEEHFSSILNASMFNWAANESFNGHYFKSVQMHAHSKVLKKIQERYFGEPVEYIFKKDVREFKNGNLSASASPVIV